MNDKIQLFENQKIRTAWDAENEKWYFSIVDVVGVLSESTDSRKQQLQVFLANVEFQSL